MVMGSCSRSKDAITSRTYHRMVSKFNPLFNGEQALLKAQQSLRDAYEEDFDEILPVFIIGDEQAASAVKPDLEKAIEKGTKVISQHSMMIRNKQKNSFIDDSYLLIGMARYYDREYLKALETFNYVIQEFGKKDDEMRLRAEYWAARTETALENYLPAQARFDRIYRDEDLPKDLKGEVFAAYAQLEIDRNRRTNAYQLIIQAADRAPDKQREVRWLFIAAQLQESLGNDYEAGRLYQKVIKKGPPYNLLFNAQLNQARAFDPELQPRSEAFEKLEEMLEDDKNFDNRDKIYYVMAEVAEKLEEEDLVIYYLNRSIQTSTDNQEQKALSYLWLAELSFEAKEYPRAQAYYDSTFSTLPSDHPNYERIKALKESLGKLVDNLNIISEQDSLLNLATMSEAERLAVAEKIIEKIKEEEARKAQEAQQKAMEQMAFNNQGGANQPAALAGTGEANTTFYFYNPTLRSSGAAAFTQRWGNRRLADDWRRKNKKQIANEQQSQPGSSAGAKPDGEEEEDPRYQPETYLAEIPLSDSSQAISHQKIQEALYGNGLIYKEEILDMEAAEQSLLEILSRYPNYEEEAKVWYTLYRVNLLQEDQAEAEKYKNLVLTNYPNSQYAFLIKNDGKKSVDEAVVKAAYESAYQAFENKNYQRSLSEAREGYKKYNQTSFAPMFLMLQAMSEGYLGELKEYRASLEILVEAFPNTEQGQRAATMLGQLANEGEGEAQEGSAAVQYRSNFADMHRYVIMFKNKGGISNRVAIKLSDFNKKYYPNDRLRAKGILMGSEYAVVTVSGLPNKDRAMQYYQTLNNERALEQELLSIDFKQFVISNANFSTFYTNQDIKGYQEFFETNYQNQ